MATDDKMAIYHDFYNKVESGEIDGQEVACKLISWLSSDDIVEFIHSEGYDESYPELEYDESPEEEEDEQYSINTCFGCSLAKQEEEDGMIYCRLLNTILPDTTPMCSRSPEYV